MKHISHTVHGLERLDAFLRADDVQSASAQSSALLVQIFSANTDQTHIQEIVDCVQATLPNCIVVGATTVGEVINGHTVTGQTVIGLTFFETSQAKAISLPCDPGQERNIGDQLIRKIEETALDVTGVLLLTTPLSIDAAELLSSFVHEGHTYPVFGGGAGDYAAMETPAVFCSSDFLTQGVVAVVLSGKDLHIDNRTYLGWRPLSKEMTVTKTQNLVVKTVDDKPAFDIYSRYLGIPNDDDFFLNVLEFPFLMERNGQFVARVPVAVDAEGGLQFVADIQEGETFRIGYGDPKLIVTDAEEIHAAAQEFSPQAIFLYTCGCRRFLMQEDVELETLPFESIAPTFGFYTYGEFYSNGQKPELLNSTMVAVSLREGDTPNRGEGATKPASAQSFDDDPYANKHARIISRLVHFIHAATHELEEANREILNLSVTDSLTGLYNRMKLDSVLTQTLNMAERYDQPFAVVLLDIDHFKQVNDTYGHLVGDDVLVRIGEVSKRTIRDVDTLGRWGGEEFVLILPNTNVEQAAITAEKLREAIAAEPIPVVGTKTSSFGVTAYVPGDSMTSILARADEALYQAKLGGRNTVKVKMPEN